MRWFAYYFGGWQLTELGAIGELAYLNVHADPTPVADRAAAWTTASGWGKQ